MTIHPGLKKQLTVGTQRIELMFKDGTTVTLHPVMNHGEADPYLRALPLPSGPPLVVDLRDIVPQIGADICTALPGDVPGIVFYTLRHAFKTAELLVLQIHARGRPLQEHHLEAA